MVHQILRAHKTTGYLWPLSCLWNSDITLFFMARSGKSDLAKAKHLPFFLALTIAFQVAGEALTSWTVTCRRPQEMAIAGHLCMHIRAGGFPPPRASCMPSDGVRISDVSLKSASGPSKWQAALRTRASVKVRLFLWMGKAICFVMKTALPVSPIQEKLFLSRSAQPRKVAFSPLWGNTLGWCTT